jgi:hypothetical protein
VLQDFFDLFGDWGLVWLVIVGIYGLYRVCKYLTETSGRGPRRRERDPRPSTPTYEAPSEDPYEEEIPSPIRRSRRPRWRSSEHELTVAVCQSCGSGNNPAMESCWQCSKSLVRAPRHTQILETSRYCAVCKDGIYPGERIVLCPDCQVQGHHSEFLEFIKVKLECPECGQRLRPSQLLDAEPSGSQDSH